MEMSCGTSIIIERDKHGYYAYCPELPGCQSQGNSLDEVMGNIREAVELYLETQAKDAKATSFVR